MPQPYNIPMPNVVESYNRGVDRARTNLDYAREQEALRQEQIKNALIADAYRRNYDPGTGRVNTNALMGELAKAGYGADIPKYMQTYGDLEKTRIANFADELKNQKGLLSGVSDQASWDAWSANAASRLGPELARFIPPTYSEEAKRKLMLDADKQYEQVYRDFDLGGTKSVLGSPKYGGPSAEPVFGGQVTMTPYEEGRLAIERREAEQRAAKEEGGIAETVTDASGNVRFFDKSGREIVPVTAQGMQTPVRGKPTATYEKAELARTNLMRDTGMAISQLQEALKPGGLLDTATGSGAGRMVDVTAGFFGKATPGAIATGQLQPIADLVLKLVPRFEGPQSDKDTQSYREAAGQLADSTLPNEIRRAAAETIIRLMEARRNQFTYEGGGSMGGGGGDEVDSSNPLLR